MLMHFIFDKIVKFVTLKIILKTEQKTIVYARWDRLASYDVIKHVITTDVIIKISLNSKGNEESALLRADSSRTISYFKTLRYFKLKVISFFAQNRKVSQRMESSCNVRVLHGSLLVYWCQFLPFL